MLQPLASRSHREPSAARETPAPGVRCRRRVHARGDRGNMYIVPRVPLIPQSKTWACWYAAAEMLIQWKRESVLSTLAAHPSPSQVPELEKVHAANSGLSYSQVLQLARHIGLLPIPPQSVPLDEIEDWLRLYGPLWTHGTQHIIVICGADPQGDRIFVHDPWPPNVGCREWRSYSRWFIHGGQAGSRGTSHAVQASFLYHP